MRITYVELENIKSYRENTRIELSEGVNAVCGLNGSGKSTLLEAIGYALFNSLPYHQQAFVREGEKSGTIRVGLLTRDEREYEVVRKVGSGAGHAIHDAEGGERIADRKEALNWIRQTGLNVDGEVDLEALFKNAVGVPQGLMTSIFQEAAGPRKSVFDPLLRVEEYRTAFTNLLDTVRFLEKRIGQENEDIARLSGIVQDLPARVEEARRRSEELAESEKRLAGLRAELADAEERKKVLDALEAEVTRLEGDLRVAEFDVTRCADVLRTQGEQLARAEEARRLVEAAEPGYLRVLAAREEQATLELRRAEREALNTKLSAAQAERAGVFEQIGHLDEELLESNEAGTRAASLVDAVARQRELEDRLQEARNLAGQAVRLDRELTKVRAEITALETARRERESSLAKAREAQGRSEHQPEVQRRLETMLQELATIDTIKGQLQSVKDEGTKLREQFDRLQEGALRRKVADERLTVLASLLASAESLEIRDRELRERRARTIAAREYQEFARRDLKEKRCPLLDLQCPVVTADAAVLVRFEARDATLLSQSAEVERALEVLSGELTASRAAAEEAQKLRIEVARFDVGAGELSEIDELLKECRSRYRELTERIAGEDALRREHGEVQRQLELLRADGGVAAQIPLLERQQQEDGEVLARRREDAVNLEKDRGAVREAEQEVERLAAELSSLGDPAKEQQDLLALAGRKPSLEERLAAANERLVDVSGRVKAFLATLLTFETLDADIGAQRDLIERHTGAYETYLQNQGDAVMVEVRRDEVEETRRTLDGLEATASALRGELEALRLTYDPAQHEVIRSACLEAGRAVAGEDSTRVHLKKDLERITGELEELRRIEAKLRVREQERDGLLATHGTVRFIRQTINDAGPAVTESLLKNISVEANSIYAEIVDDHAVELRWDRDYEILVQRGTETRKFAQLSGGEQMSAALAVRLALLREMSEVDFAFFDEPTQNMDEERRGNLAGQIRAVRGFNQLIVISHDDTFEHHTDNLIRLRKVHEETQLEIV